MREYIPFLEELEAGLYDAEDNLQLNPLMDRIRKDGWWTFKEGNRAIETLGISPLELPQPVANNITCVPPKLVSIHAPHSGGQLQ